MKAQANYRCRNCKKVFSPGPTIAYRTIFRTFLQLTVEENHTSHNGNLIEPFPRAMHQCSKNVVGMADINSLVTIVI